MFSDASFSEVCFSELKTDDYNPWGVVRIVQNSWDNASVASNTWTEVNPSSNVWS